MPFGEPPYGFSRATIWALAKSKGDGSSLPSWDNFAALRSYIPLGFDLSLVIADVVAWRLSMGEWPGVTSETLSEWQRSFPEDVQVAIDRRLDD